VRPRPHAFDEHVLCKKIRTPSRASHAAHIGKQGIRRAVARPYPYVIFYRPDTTGIVVHAVRHAAREPL
jgi:plasmid stabilization system protein ParE